MTSWVALLNHQISCSLAVQRNTPFRQHTKPAAGNTTSGSRDGGMFGRIAHWFMGSRSSGPPALLQVVASSDRDESAASPVGHADAVQVQAPAVKPAIMHPGLSDFQEPYN